MALTHEPPSFARESGPADQDARHPDGALVTIATPDDHVAEITMRDARGRNAMSEPLLEALVDALVRAGADPDTRVVVLAGLPDVFSSGAAPALLKRLANGGAAPTDILLPKVLLDLPIPTIAAMEGHAIGGGFALGACCDMAILARESRYGLSFMNMGFTPGMGTTELLGHVLSGAVVAELVYGGEPKKGRWFEGKSGFNAIVARDQVLPRARALAARIAEKPRLSLELTKQALSLPRRRAFERSHTIESLMHRVSFAQPGLLDRIEEHHAQ